MGVGFFQEKARDIGVGAVVKGSVLAEKAIMAVGTRVDALADKQFPQYGAIRDKLINPSDTAQKGFGQVERRPGKEHARQARRSGLSGAEGNSHADILKEELTSLIQARKDIQAIIIENKRTLAERLEVGKNDVAVGSGLGMFVPVANWLIGFIPGRTPTCDGEPIPGQQKAPLSNWVTMILALGLSYGSYKTFYEPVQKTFEKELAELQSWVDEYTTEIKELMADLNQTGHGELVNSVMSEHAELVEERQIPASMTP